MRVAVVLTFDELMRQAHLRRARCEAIAIKARALGLDTTWERVNRRYATWCRWDEGRLATGYLMRQTGVRQVRK